MVLEGIAANAKRSGRIAPAGRRRTRLRTRLARNGITVLVWSVYLGLGVATAGAYGYLDIDRAAPMPIASAVLAVLCWPAVFLGTSVRL